MLVNIGPRGRTQRLVLAWVMAIVLAVLVGCAVALQWPRPLRLLAAVPLFIGALGFFQARGGT